MTTQQSSRSITIPIGKNEYTVKYPNVGQQMNIEILKIQLTDGRYDTMKFSYNPAFIKQAEIAEAIATFNILIPDLKKDLNAKSMLELEQDQMLDLLTAYTEKYLPWYEEWAAILAAPKQKEVEDKKETNV
jgi:hypothetical protein